jgi:hypothetical protein
VSSFTLPFLVIGSFHFLSGIITNCIVFSKIPEDEDKGDANGEKGSPAEDEATLTVTSAHKIPESEAAATVTSAQTQKSPNEESNVVEFRSAQESPAPNSSPLAFFQLLTLPAVLLFCVTLIVSGTNIGVLTGKKDAHFYPLPFLHNMTQWHIIV